jgi:hypothetical protein
MRCITGPCDAERRTYQLGLSSVKFVYAWMPRHTAIDHIKIIDHCRDICTHKQLAYPIDITTTNDQLINYLKLTEALDRDLPVAPDLLGVRLLGVLTELCQVTREGRRERQTHFSITIGDERG